MTKRSLKTALSPAKDNLHNKNMKRADVQASARLFSIGGKLQCHRHHDA